MKISIITVSYNSADTIADTLGSVRSQSYAEKEHIIVDGASKDNTLEIVRAQKINAGSILSEPDKGIYDAMNKGLKLATGDVIGILNSDDLYADERVLDDVAEKFKSSGADALYADLVYVDRDDTSNITRYWKAGSYHNKRFLQGWMPPHPTFFVKREVYEKFGDFNTTLRSAADYEIMLRFLHKHKISVAYLPRVITLMRVGGASNVTLKHRIKANREDRRAWSLNNLQPYPWTLLLKPVSKLGQFFSKPPAK